MAVIGKGLAPAVVIGFYVLGLALMAFGTFRLIVASKRAQQRASTAAATIPENRERYIRGLTDFYRLTGSLVIFAGLVLILVLNFAR